jgi:hypothetical protein
VKPKKDDPMTRKKKEKQKKVRKVNPRKIEGTKYLFGFQTDGSGKGFLASKGTAKQAGTAFLAVIMVIDLTLFSSSFVVGSFLETQEGSVVPEYVQNFENSSLQQLNTSLKKENNKLCPMEFFLGYILQLLDVSHQWLDFLSFSLRWKSIPRR